jgi:transcription-repair coupling factor (superfamily II helicase)
VFPPDIESIADKIQSIVPEAKIAIGHGQMTSEQLERTMSATSCIARCWNRPPER